MMLNPRLGQQVQIWYRAAVRESEEAVMNPRKTRNRFRRAQGPGSSFGTAGIVLGHPDHFTGVTNMIPYLDVDRVFDSASVVEWRFR